MPIYMPHMTLLPSNNVIRNAVKKTTMLNDDDHDDNAAQLHNLRWPLDQISKNRSTGTELIDGVNMTTRLSIYHGTKV